MLVSAKRLAALCLTTAIAGSAYAAVHAQSKPGQLASIGSNFYIDLSTVKGSGPAYFVAKVIEKDSTGIETVLKVYGTFSCLGGFMYGEPSDLSTPENRFAHLHAEKTDSVAAQKACAAAHIDSPEIRFARTVGTALAEARESLAASRWKLVAGDPSLIASNSEQNKIAIFIDKESIAGVTGNFAVYPLDKLRAAMREDSRAELLDVKSFQNPGFPSGPEARGTLIAAVATTASQRIEPSARYTATYDCDRQTVRVQAGAQVESDTVGFYGADPRNIAIAARYFCPSYAVQGVSFYKYDK